MTSILSPAEQHLTLPSPPSTPSPPPPSSAAHKPPLLSRPTNTNRSFPPSSSPTAHEITFYTPGDLLLSIPSRDGTSPPTNLRVASAALCIASPVFRAMLAPGRFSEGHSFASSLAHNTGPYTLTLPDDDPQALTILCHLLHHNHHLVPRAISPHALAALCVALDKYVCVLAAASWLDYWFAHHPIAASDDPAILIQWLYISTVAREPARFRFYSAVYISSGACADPETMPEPQAEWFDRLPAGVQAALTARAQGQVAQAAGVVARFLEGGLARCRAKGAGVSPETCDAFAAGAVLRRLREWWDDDAVSPKQDDETEEKVGLFVFLARPERYWKGSARELVEGLERVARGAEEEERVGGRTGEKHERCHQARVLSARLRELRVLWAEGRAAGLELEEFRGKAVGACGAPRF